ncbi:urea ABC transporter, permease protein UrtB [Natronolimnobius baerhuensis]|uniref:Branched-chain amino acid ABC transporter permease n=1 Tax=Natronolimnobius baerhuensis TaxID=253108 RepID=A0A202E548_9EURY|nr:urea ABC transporter, permease protein UrtB [Natronolimnobius baerhuensis]OVE83324.1 branched-chain amino acid ABC transporter permease [Natronolimnobius baerhuensis]
MDALYELLNFGFQFLDSFAFIVLATIGLAIIFGMMGIINLAHGEFILVGAYATTLSFHAGLPLPLAMVAGVVVTTIFGVILERTIIRHLYGRLLDSMVVTFGISLVMVQLTRIVFGNSLNQIGTPFGGISYGPYSYSTYRSVFLASAAIVTLVALYVVFTRTTFGVRARATIQDEETARSMGVDTDRMYLSTFAIGSALAGLTGALYAPATTMSPELGTYFLVEAFVAVVVGGPSVLLGTPLAGALLGAVDAFFANLWGQFIGTVFLLLTAIIAIRVMPDGITGLLRDLREKWGQSE